MEPSQEVTACILSWMVGYLCSFLVLQQCPKDKRATSEILISKKPCSVIAEGDHGLPSRRWSDKINVSSTLYNFKIFFVRVAKNMILGCVLLVADVMSNILLPEVLQSCH